MALKKRGTIKNRSRLINNGITKTNKASRRIALDALENALLAVDPYECVLRRVKCSRTYIKSAGQVVSLSGVNRILVLAVGKAAGPMMKAALRLLNEHQVHGIVVAPKGGPLEPFDNRVRVFRSGHPYPDIDGLRASREVIQSVTGMKGNELLLCLISGGASALLPAPAVGIPLQDKIKTTKMLVRSRATIHEINTVRRHISKLKGGQLAQISGTPKILSLIISDVPGNILPDIGSGLTVGDPTSFGDAVRILKRLGLWDKLPHSVAKHLTEGTRGIIRETPKPGDPHFKKVRNIIIADNETACKAAKQTLESNRIRTNILTVGAETSSKKMGLLMVSLAKANKPSPRSRGKGIAFVLGGETTIEVKGKGLGGRNQEVVLSAIGGISRLEGVVVAALGTDGVDGNSKAAGALADGRSSQCARRIGMNPQDFLRRNDSYHFFAKLHDNLVTGPTGTNVGDLYLVIRSR